MKRVLLTGARGFIGSHCLQPLLAQGYEIHAITSQHPPNAHNSMTHWHQVDLLNAAQVKDLVATVQATHLLHFAWYVAHNHYWTASENFQWVSASLNLLQIFAEHGGQRAVMAGTCAEYDWSYGYCSEYFTPTSPSTIYGQCKNALQNLVAGYAQSTHLSTAWGRIFSCYGPHENPARIVPYVIQSLLQKQTAACSSGHQARDFLYVQDLADAFVALLSSDLHGPVNVASGQPLVLKDLIYEIAGQIGYPELVHLGVRPAAANDPPLLLADTRRLQTEIAWQPRYNLAQGITATINWWQEQTEQ